MKSTQFAPQVREQYEALPYPPRDPADEHKRLAKTWLDDLPMINHYCYAGRASFREGFRVLVAGGGTGDATIFLAEQLRGTDAAIVHIDLSGASIDIARSRAGARRLDNITWIRDSLLALPELGLGRFDYVNCSGVLHHLDDPAAGLRALLAVLADTGALGIMLYGAVGRTGIYQMQSLLRLVNGDEADARRRIANARQLLAALPPTNWFRRGEADLYHDHKDLGDAGLYDLLLHSHDRAYTVGEILDWFGGCGLHVEFTDVQRGRAPYLPELVLGTREPQLADRLRQLPPRRRYEIAELLGGTLVTHSFFATRAPRAMAPYGDIDYVPFFFHEPVSGAELSGLVRSHGGKPFVINHAHTGVSAQLDPGKYGEYIIRHVDGRNTFGDIFARVRQEPALAGRQLSDAELFSDFRPFYDFLAAIDRVLLRHRSIAPLAVT